MAVLGVNTSWSHTPFIPPGVNTSWSHTLPQGVNTSWSHTLSPGILDTYYHYTTKEAAKQILQTGRINQSTDTRIDAVFGTGVYFTKLGYWLPAIEIAINNYVYDGGIDNALAYQMLEAGRVDAIIAVDLPRFMAVKQECQRDVYVVPGDVTLPDKKHKLYLRDSNGMYKEVNISEFILRDIS